MEIIRDSMLALIFLGLVVTQTPQGQELVNNQGPSNVQSIDKAAAGIESNTDEISNLLTQQNFDDEDFAQESTIQKIQDTNINQENHLQSIDNYQEKTFSDFINKTSFTNGYFSTQSSTIANAQTELGNLFIATHVETSLPSGEKMYYIFETGNNEPAQTRIDLTGTGALRIKLYENGSRLGGSQGVTIANGKRNSGKTHDTMIYNTTDSNDIGDKGVLIEDTVSGSGSSIGSGTAGSVSSGAKWIFRSNETYIVSLENLESSSVSVGFASDFYELTAEESS